MDLESLGAGPDIYGAFEAYAARGLILGRVALAQRGQYRLFTAAAELSAEASGALWYRAPSRASMPVAGDWVAARAVGPQQAIVEGVKYACCTSRNIVCFSDSSFAFRIFRFALASSTWNFVK